MIQNLKGKRSGEIYALDFQGRNSQHEIETNTTSLYLTTLVKEGDRFDNEEIYSYSVEQFIMQLEELTTPSKRHNSSDSKQINNIGVYVYDLGAFFSFIFPYLKIMGFRQVAEIDGNTNFKSYSVLTDETPAIIWLMELKINANGGVVVFKSIDKMFSHNGSLEDMAAHLGLKFHLPKIDIFKYREPTYNATEEEKKASFKRAVLILDILLNMREEKEFFLAFTIASYSMRKLINYSFGWAKNPKGCYRSKKNYPLLEPQIEEAVRNSICGGLASPNPIFQNEEIENMIHIDASQHYPSCQKLYNFPYGEPAYFEGCNHSNKLMARLLHVKLWGWTDTLFHCLPILDQQSVFIAYNRVFEMWVWDFELEMAKVCYTGLEYKILEGYEFKTKPIGWIGYFEENIAMRQIARINNDSFGVALYKLMNNAPIGKFFQKSRAEEYEPYINEQGVTKNKKVSKEQKAVAGYAYSPLGSYTLARGRWRLFKMAKRFGFENIVYKDTDSLFIISNKKTEAVIKDMQDRGEFHKGLGGWTLCDRATNGKFIMPKRYSYIDENGEVHTKAAGITINNEGVDLENAKIQMYVKKFVCGGCIKTPIIKTLKGGK